MALVTTVITSHVPGDRKFTRFTLALDASYPTGGYPLPTAAQLGFNSSTTWILPVCFSALVAAVAGGDFVINKATNKIQMFTAAGAEFAAATSFAGVTIEGIAEGF